MSYDQAMTRKNLFWKIFPLVAVSCLIVGAASAAIAVSGVEPAYGIALVALLAISVASGSSWLAQKAVAGPLGKITQGAARLAMGRFDTPVSAGGTAEMDKLAETLNHVARELKDKIEAGASQAQSGEAILSCIEEGVLAVDQDRIILKLNPEARNMLNIRASRAEGLPLGEVCNHGELLRFVEEGLKTRRPDESEITIDGPRKGYIQLTRSPLYRSNGEYWGLVMALGDITRIKRLENLRADFASNVSHELRTPLTSIKASVETLRSGAAGDLRETGKFLDIIERHINRLNSIIEDLLSLSRIESAESARAISFETLPLKEVLEEAVGEIASKASEKGVRIELECDADLRAAINAPLLESGVVNLVDNAINYSEAGKTVWITALETGGVVSIRVRDQGCGIDKSHLDRIFERFYRVDSARSRKLGGTGLGLSIVKHIALAHGGRVTVDSAKGEGSVFSIHIPAGHESGNNEDHDD